MVYVRISLDAAGEGLGVQRQEDECRALCGARGWEVSEVYSDNDISATTGKSRPDFERLLASGATRVVVWHTDRLVRVTKDLERVIALDIPVVAVTAGELDLATPAGRAVARTITAWSTYEGEQKSERQRAAHRQRVEAGKPFWSHRRPFGYLEDGRQHEEEAVALAECYERVRLGSTYGDCARWLNDEGFRTTTGRKLFTGSKLSLLMRHPRNAGFIQYKGEVAGRGLWEPIVSEEEWRAILDRATAIASSRAPQPAGQRTKSLLGGIARCAECDEPMKRTRQHSKRKSGDVVKTYIYQCPAHCTSIRADWLDDHVTKAVIREASKPAWALAMGPSVDEGDAMDAATEAVELRDRLADLATAFAEGDINRDQLKAGSAALQRKLVEAEGRAQTYYSASPFDSEFTSAAALLEAWQGEGAMTLTQKREAVAKFTERLAVRKRANRNERANEGMVALRMRKPA